MMSTWREVRTDLKEMALLHKMDHDLTFRDFIEHLSQDSALRWVTYEAARLTENELLARGFLFDAWLEVELKILKASNRTDSHKDVGRTHDTKDDRSDRKDKATGPGGVLDE